MTLTLVFYFIQIRIDTAEKKPFRNEKFKDLNCQVAFTNLFNEKGKLEKELGLKIYNELLRVEILTI